MPINEDRATVLERRIAHFIEAIAAFERSQDRLRERRRGAADHIMVEIDERLAVNASSLEALHRGMASVQRELREIIGGPGGTSHPEAPAA
jgi:hypothetical protein